MGHELVHQKVCDFRTIKSSQPRRDRLITFHSDAGGVDGYAELVAAYAKPNDRRSKDEREKIKWVAQHPFGYRNFHPDRFVPSQVKWNKFNSKIWGD